MTIPVEIRSQHGGAHGELVVPADAAGLVVIAHAAEWTELGPRDTALAKTLQDQRLATLSLGSLTYPDGHRSDPDAATALVDEAVELAESNDLSRHLPVGLYGSDLGAVAALRVATSYPGRIGAVVARSGRTDLVGAGLAEVTAATLLIVGDRDAELRTLNERCLTELPNSQLRVIPGASRTFEEIGTMEAAAEMSAIWFADRLR